MNDLRPFTVIIQQNIDDLEQLSNAKTHQKNSKYYESTLSKLIEKLFQQENDEEEDGMDDRTGYLNNRGQ